MTFNDPIQFPEGNGIGIDTDVLARWVSTGGLWHVDICRVFYGYRLKIGLAPRPHELRGAHGYEVEYCMGATQLTLRLLPWLVMKILERVPECEGILDKWNTEVRTVRDLFPMQKIKPMHLDHACWAALCVLGGVAELSDIDLSAGGELEMDDLLGRALAGRVA